MHLALLAVVLLLACVAPIASAQHGQHVPPGQAKKWTPTPVTGWHTPTTHEHGDPPPAWAVGAFTQARESHAGYKGTYARMANGVESYLITHILSTAAARSHGDHDYQLWMRDPTGGVSFWQGVLDFGTPPALRTSDDGTRPVILSVGDGGCETWYSRAGVNVMDVGWTICDRYEAFSGAVLAGRGLFRGMDWTVPANRLGAPGYDGVVAPTLAPFCVVEFGVCRFSFIVSGHENPGPNVVPVN